MAARDPLHAKALQQQYTQAFDQVRDSLEREFRELERWAAETQAVLCADLEKLEPLMQGKMQILPSYWDLHDFRSLASDAQGGPNWHKMRQKAEIELVDSAQHRDRLHYAALSGNQTGLSHYGKCTILLREEMIAHRATVYRNNSALEVNHSVGARLHSGGLAEWKNRGRLVATKLADQLQPGMGKDEFQQLLLRSGKPENKGADDVFVEVLVFGELSLHAFVSMTITLDAAIEVDVDISKPLDHIPDKIRTQYSTWEDRCSETRVGGVSVELKFKITGTSPAIQKARKVT